jgi:hypothetical protein
MKKWLWGWSMAGLVVPLLYLAIYLVTGYTLREGIDILWPGSLGLMVLENRPPATTVVFVWSIAIASNGVLYAVIGLLLWPLARLRSKTQSAGEPKK